MKRFIRISAVTLAVIITAFACITGFSADEAALKVNGAVEANIGDKLTYTLYIADVPEKTEDIQMDIYFDSKCLKVDKDTIKHIEGGSPIFNADTIDGQILFNSANGVQGWDLKKKTMLFQVGFDVIGTGETDISYYIECMDYLSNSTSIDEYTITCDYAVNDAKAEEAVPKVNPNGTGGDFQNYENGKGAKNGGDKLVGSPNSNNTPAPAVEGNSDTAENAEAQDETTVVLTNSSGQAITNPDGSEKTQSESQAVWRYIIVAVLAAAIVGCIILKVMLEKKKKTEVEDK